MQPTSSVSSSLASTVGGSCHAVSAVDGGLITSVGTSGEFETTGGSHDKLSQSRRKRQNSEGDSLVWRGSSGKREGDTWPRLARRGSEGSEVDVKRGGVFSQLIEKVRIKDDKRKSYRDYESDVDESRSNSRERARGGRQQPMEQQELAERLIDKAAATFDASAVPERPKSACESTILRAAEELYLAALAARPTNIVGRSSADRIEVKPRSRDNSLGRARSAERDEGSRTAKVVPRAPTNRPSDFSTAEVKAIVHTEASQGKVMRRDKNTVYAIATVPRKSTGKKENIYENVKVITDPGAARAFFEAPRPVFKKQNSLDALPSELRTRTTPRRGESVLNMVDNRRGTLRKADSFEGHEEAVRTLVAAVQENRLLRRKKTK